MFPVLPGQRKVVATHITGTPRSKTIHLHRERVTPLSWSCFRAQTHKKVRLSYGGGESVWPITRLFSLLHKTGVYAIPSSSERYFHVAHNVHAHRYCDGEHCWPCQPEHRKLTIVDFERE